MLKSKLNRLFIGGILGAFCGFSCGFTVLPWAVENVMVISDELILNMARFAVPASVLWIPGGALAGLRGGMRQGAIIMGAAGALAGLVYAVWLTGTSSLLFMGTCMLAAALYGVGAGLLVGGGLPQPFDGQEAIDEGRLWESQ